MGEIDHNTTRKTMDYNRIHALISDVLCWQKRPQDYRRHRPVVLQCCGYKCGCKPPNHVRFIYPTIVCKMETGILRCHTCQQNGMKQGGVLSAILFFIYMDEIIWRLEHSDIGCYIGKTYYGSISYADDFKLLCPSINGLRKCFIYVVFYMCCFFARIFLNYNANMIIAICYGKSGEKSKRSLCLDGEYTRWELSVKYLGIMHCSPMTNGDDITY